MEYVSGVCYVLGAAFVLLGAIGVLRFGDFMSRTHAATKAPTLGLILVALGTAIDLHTLLAVLTMVLVVLAQLFTTPVGTHMVARAAHGELDIDLDGDDELARDKLLWAAEAEADAAGESSTRE
ncbi:MAG: monovalent cation/H(+) antiporter subunit G [Acidimicrobiia bacterium]|nr:monovalent cation/H(+) antiporter subunit G [Acidimicrobiia bacterium]